MELKDDVVFVMTLGKTKLNLQYLDKLLFLFANSLCPWLPHQILTWNNCHEGSGHRQDDGEQHIFAHPCCRGRRCIFDNSGDATLDVVREKSQRRYGELHTGLQHAYPIVVLLANDAVAW